MRSTVPMGEATLCLVLSGVLLAAAGPVHGQPPGQAEEQAGRWLEAFDASFNVHLAEEAAALYAADADQRVSRGEFLRGRAEIEAYLAELFARNPGVVQRSSLTSARFSGPDLLFVETTWEIAGLPEDRRAAGMATYILRREGAGWVCIAGRSMVPP